MTTVTATPPLCATSGTARTVVAGFAAVVAAALFLLGNRLGEPRQPVWDEAYYLPAVARYEEGRAQFASHPPLGLMLIAAGDRMSGLNADIDKRSLAAATTIRGETMPAGYDYRGPRLASALFGALGAGLFFLLMLELTGSVGAALVLSPLYLCDTALIAQFRAGHLDAFQIFFALAATLCALRLARARDGAGWALGFGAAVACATLVRANGIVLAALLPLTLCPLLAKAAWRRAEERLILAGSGAFLAIGAVTLAYFAVTTQAPATDTAAGRRDAPFLSAPHRQAIASGKWPPEALGAAWRDHARFITADLAGMAKSDPNGSHPGEWPFGMGAITYRWDASPGHFAALGLVPNLAAWLLSLTGVVWAIRSLRRSCDLPRALLLVGWFAQMATFVWLDGQRVLYLYHYFVPLLMGHALLALAWRAHGLPQRPASIALLAVGACYALAAPLALDQATGRWRCELLLPDCGPDQRISG